jgi:hypothetical protein
VQGLFDEVEEMLSRARYMEKKQPNTEMGPIYWARLTAACQQARQLCPDALQNVVPDETHQTWAEAAICLEAINEVIHDLHPAAK